MTGFVFGVIAWAHHPLPHCGVSCYLDLKDGPFSYVYRNALLQINHQTVADRGVGAFLGNGLLWTLFYEFLCYMLLAVLAMAGLLRRRIWTATFTLGLWTVVTIITLTPALERHFSPEHHQTEMNLAKFAVIFLTGSLVFLYRERVPDSGLLVP